MQITKSDVGRSVIRRDGVVDKIENFSPVWTPYFFGLESGNTLSKDGLWRENEESAWDAVGFVDDEDDPVLLSEKHIGALVALRNGDEAFVERIIFDPMGSCPVKLDNGYWYSLNGQNSTIHSGRDIVRVEALSTQVDAEVLVTADDIGRLVRLRGGDTTRINVCLEDGLYRVRASNGRAYSPDGREYAGSITTNDIVDFIAEETDDGPVEDDKTHFIGEGLGRIMVTESKDPFDQLVTLYINSSDPVFRRIIRLGMLRLGQQAEVSSE